MKVVEEIWKPTHYQNYDASNLGRIRGPRKILTPYLGTRGYLTCRIYCNGPATELVHILVAFAFCGPRPDGLVVNHKDGVKANNVPGNLEYITDLENHRHASRLGLKATGLRHGKHTHPEAWRKHNASAA